MVQEDCVVSGEAVWFQDRRGFRLCGCRLGGGFRKGWVVLGRVVWYQERLGCFMKNWPVVSGKVWRCQEMVAGKTGWYHEFGNNPFRGSLSRNL